MFVCVCFCDFFALTRSSDHRHEPIVFRLIYSIIEIYKFIVFFIPYASEYPDFFMSRLKINFQSFSTFPFSQ